MSSSNLRDFVSLPEDILTPIFRLLNQRDRCSISYTCRFLRDLSRPTRFRDVEVYPTAFHKLCNLVRQEEFASHAKLVQQMTLTYCESLSFPIAHLFPSLTSLKVDSMEEVDRTFLASLGGLPSLRTLDLEAYRIGVADSSDFHLLKLTSLSVAVKNYRNNNLNTFLRHILSGSTQKSIVTLAIHSISIRSVIYGKPFDPFLNSAENFPSLRRLTLLGFTLKPTLSRFPVLFPALIYFNSTIFNETPIHGGKAGLWEALEELAVTYDPKHQADERILRHAPRLKRVDLQRISSDSALQIFGNITSAGTNALQLTSVSIEMALSTFNVIIKEDILEQAFCAMKNLEHFALVGYGDMTAFLPFRWMTSEGRFASMLSNTTSLRTLRMNMTLDAMTLFPDNPEAVLSFVKSNKKRYTDLTRNFVARCPSLEVVTWGFGKGAKRWWHMPVKGFDGEGGVPKINVDDELLISDTPVYEED